GTSKSSVWRILHDQQLCLYHPTRVHDIGPADFVTMTRWALLQGVPGMYPSTLLEDVPLIVRRQIWIQHDRAPAHFSSVLSDYLDAAFHGRWIGRGSPMPWPPRSPDLNL
ncbi:hypothetical protein B7P43_G07556, partial [Cryptotermes secundus]